MAKSSRTNSQNGLFSFLAKLCGTPPQVLDLGPKTQRIQIARCINYPEPGLTTFVTNGAAQARVILYRGLSMAAIPIDDRELRDYDRSVKDMMEQIQQGGRIAEYPRN